MAHHSTDKPSTSSSSKKHRSSHSDREPSSSKRHRSSHSHRAPADEDEWVEKDPVLPAPIAAGTRAPVDTVGTFTVGAKSMRGETAGDDLVSLTDGYGEGEDSGKGGAAFGAIEAPEGRGSGDMFSDMGVERKRREPKEKVDPTQTMGQSSRELNKAHWQGVPNPISSTPSSAPTGSPAPGSSGSSWRMSKLRRTYEAAEEENRPVEDVALERYESLTNWHEAVEEKRVLDERESRRRGGRPSGPPSGGHTTPSDAGRRFVYTEPTGGGSAGGSGPPSRSGGSFRRPGAAPDHLAHHSAGSTSASRPGTPVPNVFTPPPASARSGLAPASASGGTGNNQTKAGPVLSQSELNRLQAKVLKARLMGSGEADQLEREYEVERVRTLEGGSSGGGAGAGDWARKSEGVTVLPTLDGRGRLYDVGDGAGPQEEEEPTGKRKKKEKAFQSHDPKTGEVLLQAADDDALSLSELVRQERFSAGAQDQKDMDYEMAGRIAGDARFQNNLDYVDENAEKLARKKMKSDVMKKAFAVQDYARTKKALDNCTLCYGDEGESPRAAVVALGTRAYLALLENEELVKGHCRIVPIQHHLSSLDADDETWDEIKNFMKTLMQMFAEEDKGVVFFESCINLRNQKHTCIEAVPVPFDLFDEIPAYFQEAIDNSEQEWSQHKKRIVFTAARPFRRSLVPNLPYFAVQWDYKGEKGYGHVIEGVDDAPDRDADGYEQHGETGEKGGGEFPRWFATEIIGSMLELEPRQWRKPRRLDFRQNKERVASFRVGYDKFDWTKLLETK